MARMDDIGVGRLIRLARQRRQWRQDDLAVAAGVSRHSLLWPSRARWSD